MAESEKSSHLPLAGKRFFIDPKVESSLAKKLRHNLVLLGGVVEDFLDKNIHFVLTNEESIPASRKCEHPAQTNLCSPFNTSVPSPHFSQFKPESATRSRKLATKARLTNVPSNSFVKTAQKLGIKIRYVEEVWQWLSKKTENFPKPEKKIPPRPTEIPLKEPCIKIEDLKHKPVYEEMESLMYLDFDGSKIQCPFVNPSASTTVKTPKKKKDADQKGFCECCQSSYLSESKHCKSVQHLNYGQSAGNYLKLDQYVSSNGLNLASFLKRARQVASKGSSVSQNDTPGKSNTSVNTKQQSLRVCSNPTVNDANLGKKTRRSQSPTKAPIKASVTRSLRPRVSLSPTKQSATTKSASSTDIIRRTSPRKLSNITQKAISPAKPKNSQVFKRTTPRREGRTISRSPSPVLSPRCRRRSTKRKLSVDSAVKQTSSPTTRTHCLRDSVKRSINNNFQSNTRTRSRTLSRESIAALLQTSNLDVTTGSTFLGF